MAVGGGFGGLAVVRSLKRAKARVILISKANYFLFQPLLYQVATSMLGPADIITPLRQTYSFAGWKMVGPAVEKGRVKVGSHCEVPGQPGIFVVGDTAAFDIGNNKFLPGLAQVAIQQGKHVGSVISSRLAADPPPPSFVISTRVTWRS